MEAMACNDIITSQVPRNAVMRARTEICGAEVAEN